MDLGLLMCDASSQGGITSHEGNDADVRPLTPGGSEAWLLIRKARNEVWEKAGHDADTLYCPQRAEDIDIHGASDLSSGQSLNVGFPVDASFQWNYDNMNWPMLATGTESDWIGNVGPDVGGM